MQVLLSSSKNTNIRLAIARVLSLELIFNNSFLFTEIVQPNIRVTATKCLRNESVLDQPHVALNLEMLLGIQM